MVGALLVVFSWFYVTSLALLVGAEVNVAVERARSRRPRPQHQGEPLAETRTTETP